MLISAWLTSVRNRLQSPSATKRRINKNHAASAAEGLESRTLLTTTLQAVRPNVGEFLTPGEIRTVAPQELTLQFSLGSTITPSTITSQAIQVFRSGSPNDVTAVFGDGNDVPVTIGYVGPGSSPNEVVLRFGETLGDEHYRIVINGTGPNRLTATVSGPGGPVSDPVEDATFDFQLDLGAKIVAVDPQPVTRLANGTLSQARDQIVLYFNNDDLNSASAQNVNFYQLIATKETVTSADDVIHLPISAVYDAAADTVTLTFASDIANLSGAGSYRLRVGNAEMLPQAPVSQVPASDPGSSFGTALTIPTPSTSTNTSRIISSSIDAQLLALAFPGAGDEPGHREIEVENHLNGGADTGASGIPYREYNFQDVYGSVQGQVVHNLITEAQKDRAREIFAIYSEYAGIDFRETAASGLTIVTGDMRALKSDIPTGPGGVGGLAGGGMAIMDMAENWGNLPGESWFGVAMHEIGHLLGQGHTYDLPAPTVQGSGSSGSTANTEPTVLGDHDILHIRHQYRPDSIDIDLYKFQVDTSSLFSAEVMAERLANSSRLDSVLRLYREVSGQRELISQNDNYFSKDSYLELTLEPGVYYVGVSSTGNDAYDPTIANTGIGGTSEGAYDLRVNFRPNVSGNTSTIIDTTDRTFDGDSDGLEGGVYNFWLKTASAANTLFVDKTAVSFLSAAVTAAATQIIVQRVAPFAVNDVIRIDNEQMRITAINPTTRVLTVTRAVNATTAATHSLSASVRKITSNGQIATPFGFIGDAMAVATPGQVVRIVGNGGADNDIATISDNLPYEIGVNVAGTQALPDGTSLEAPKGVTVMVDAGAVLKMHRSWVGAGSSTTTVDRSGSAVQILGVPGRQVIFTSWLDESIGTDTTPTPTSAAPGNWGGVIFRNETDRAQNRYNPENEGIFLNYVGYADIRWGGGVVTIETSTQTIDPLHMERSQPTIVHNTIQFSNASGMSADPDSFEELTFHSPRFQTGKPPFTVDYKRIGPEIYGNTLLQNGNNALFVRIDTLAGGATEKMTVPGRFNDTDIVHLVAQNLELQGTPGGAYQDNIAPSVILVTLNPIAGGTLPAGTYNYRIVFTDENGFESPASVATGNIVSVTTGSIRLAQLPPATGVYTGRRIYRSQNTGAGPYTLMAELDKSATTFTDTGVTLTRTLTAFATRDRARLDARLSIDPGIIVKLQSARIEAEFGAQLIAEGSPGRQVIFTSRLDDRYGSGGTFDTNNDDTAATESAPSPGNWGGLYIGHLGSASIDRALITFAGGNVPLGGGFSAFNPVEIHEAEARIRNTVFERNADGASSGNRSGLFPNAPGTIFVRAAQPVLLDNTFFANSGPVVNINVNALNKDFVADPGRATGMADRQLSYADNQGPLIRDNIFDSNTRNGMVVRGETLTTQSIWDDTDIVHILLDEIYVPNLHTYGGIRLESSPIESLVVKLSGGTAGFTAGGSPLDITDRIGGMLHIVGQPGQPVILTSLRDDSVGAGFNLRGLLQKDTNGDGASAGASNDWRGINIDRYSHDRNVAVYVEHEIADRLSADTNSAPDSAELIGSLAEKQQWGDENLRLGIDLQGFIDSPSDIDVYSFSGVAGSQVWIDIDRSTHALDTVVELLDSTGTILAQSDNYLSEKLGVWPVVTSPGSGIQAFGLDYSQYLSDDHYTTNANDAGLRVVLPGTVGVRGTFYIRVRSSNIDSSTAAPRTDLQDPAKISNGLTSGVYQLQVRLQEEDEFAGTTVQFADIRFATTGIQITGQPLHSPLAGESEEVEGVTGNLGNLMNTDRAALAVRGTISADDDVDFFQFEVNYTHIQQIAGVSLTGAHVPVVIDLDYADGVARADLTMAIYDSAGRLVLLSRDSNITDDQSGPLEGADTDDLSRGSLGTFDPYLGTVELPGGVYTLAVTNNTTLPSVLDQFHVSASSNNLLRVEPINSVRRIAEERFTQDDGDTYTAATAPITNLFNVTSGRVINGVERGVIDAKHVVPYHLGDVVLFVSVNQGSGTNETSIGTLNPFTGEVVTVLGDFGPSVGDIAMRPDGQLYTFSTSAANNGSSNADTAGNTGNYLRIDTGTAAATFAGDDGIDANLDNQNPVDDTIVAYANSGIRYNAMTFTGTGDTNLFAIGRRFDHTLPADSDIAYQHRNENPQNLLYRFDIRTGAVSGNGANRVATGSQAALQGAGTTQREIGLVNAIGNVTGMARVASGQVFIVDNLGFLYSLNTGNANATPITNLGTSFTSLVAGPDEVEGGKYANMLFAMTITGNLMAFDTAGILQPVFFDGQDTLNVGIPGTTGLAFSTLDRNLWQTTSVRGGDAGHGVEQRFDDSPPSTREGGGISLYFGNQLGSAAAGNANNLSNAEINNVDFPGGAHGSVVSNSFSLEGYRRTDKPVLYFNYFLDTENDDLSVQEAMRDSFRVFVGDESGTWTLVTTNNSFKGGGPADDEFDYGSQVEETFDRDQWRQARVELDAFAGKANLKLRFDFSTAGSMALGGTLTTGSELRAIDGYKLRDGDTVTVGGVNFEFDMGSSIVFPTGAAALGKSFTVGGETFTFAAVSGGSNTIVVSATDSPNQVRAAAQSRVNAVLGGGSAVSALPLLTSTNRLAFPGRTVTGASAGLVVDGAAGFTGNRVLTVTPNMTANQVAVVIRQALADEFSAGDMTNIKGTQDLIWIIGKDVDSQGPLGFADSLPGDVFGAFHESHPALRGVNNAVEGVYVDDIIIGFAERGEMVIAATNNQSFFANPDVIDTAITQGAYDVEIRRASDYAETVDLPPTNSLYRSIDTNDREAELVSLTLPSSLNVPHRSTITISDGVNQVVFEFLDQTLSAIPTPGAFPIVFNPATGFINDHDAETSISLAARLRNAINSVTVQNVLKIKASTSDHRDTGNLSTSSKLHLTGNAIVTFSADLAAVPGTTLNLTAYNTYGDQNHYRDQGQLIIRSSFVSDSGQFGIVVDASDRSPGSGQTLPGPGSVRNLHTINDDRLVTGVVIMNNVIASNAAGGIRFSGDQLGNPFGQVPYGRIVNNTIIGTTAGTGILVEQSASPTMLNNILADFATGISVDASSRNAGTTIGYSLYRGNGTNSNAGLGAFPIQLTSTDPLFVDQANRNYYPAPFSQAIDSSVTSLGDRDVILRVKGPMDLDGSNDKGSPIIAPEFDVYGQLRGNDPDVETPNGQGSAVTFDRGAIDRVDFFQPQAQLANPEDQSLIDGDLDFDEVWIDQTQTLRQFRIRLIDEGIGIDNRNVNQTQFVLKRVEIDGVTETVLVEGVDYQFVYNEITREAIFNAATFFADENTEVRYIILVDNNGVSTGDTVNGVRDLAGNYLLSNRTDGTTRFDIVLTDGQNDPPVNTVPLTTQTILEDTTLVFNQANGNAISIFDQDAHLGTNVLTVTLTATNGVLTLGSIPAGLTFAPLSGDGTADITMTFTGKLQDLNTALDGLQFIPDPDYYGSASVTIHTDDLGEFSGPAAQDTDVIAIDVTPVNDRPFFNPLVSPAAIDEDAGLVTILNFMTGQAAGPANETPPQGITVAVTVTSETGSWTPATFFAAAPSIDPVTGTLTFTTAQDVNGTATIRVVLTDDGTPSASSLAQTFVITVNPVNDAPVFTPTTTDSRVNGSGNITVLEDPGVQTINYVGTSAAALATALDEVGGQTPFTWSLSAATLVSGNLTFSELSVNPTTGVLTFNPAQDKAGSATVVLTLRDSGLGASTPLNVNTVTRTITINVTQVNDSPVAVTGNYFVDEGDSLILDASGSFDVDAFFGDTWTYEWDLDNNGTYETIAGASATTTVTWATLAGLGITAPSVRTIGLRVTDSSGASNNTGVTTATLTTQIVDYGDAPNTYGTLRANTGAAHTITGGLFLGTTVTKELDGQPSASANADSGDDGVTFPTSFERLASGQALPAYVDITASKAGKLDVWLDMDGSGVFDNATEHLNSGASYNVTAGVNRINFVIPAGSFTGDTFMRFRLSTAGTSLPTGRANDGEVEDYSVKIKSLQSPITPTINRPIDFNPSDGQIAKTTDLTPTVAWSLHDPNFSYNLVVTNSASQIVFTSNGTTSNSVEVIPALAPFTLPPGIYTATVTAFNKINTSASPATWQFEVVPLSVSSPVGEVGTSRPVINWNHVEGSKTYRVVVESIATSSIVINQTITTASVVLPAIPNRFTPTNDLPLGQYRVRVQATDAADLPGDWSPYRLFAVKTAPVVTGPAASTSLLRPTVTWNSVAGAVSYKVTLTFFTDTGTAPVITNVTGTSWTPSADLKLGEYRVTVQAFSAPNATGESSFVSAVRTFFVKTAPVVTQPIGRVPDTTPTFSWSAVPGADRYELVVSKAWGDFAEVIHWSALTSTSFTQTSKLGLGPYTYQVRAINDASNTSASAVRSDFSPVRSFSIVEPPVLNGPQLTTFSNHPAVSWVAPPNSETFDIYYRLVGDSNPAFLLVNGVTGSSYTPNEKLFGIGTYIVWVRTSSNTDNPATPRLPNGTGDERVVSNWSLGRTFRVSTPPTILGPVDRSTVANPTLTWQSVPGALNYEIWINNDSVPVSKIYNVAGITALNYTVPANLPIGQYTFWVRARNQFGFNSNWSQPQKFSVVAWPTLTGPSSSTFITRPTFNWTNMTSTLLGRTAGAARYEFRLYAPDPVTNSFVELPQYTVTNLTTNSYTIPTDLPIGNYRAYVRGIANGRPTANVPETVSDFSFFLSFFVGGRPEVTTIPATTNTTPTLLWQAVDGASGYEVFLSTAASPNDNLLNALNNKTGGTSFVVPQALNKGVYRYWIRAFNASTGGAGLWSERKTLTIVDAGNPATDELFVDPTEFVWTAVPGLVPQSMVTESAVSMLPAVVDGSQWLPLPEEMPVAEVNVSELLADNAAGIVLSVDDATITEQTDSVLSKWDEHTWWESQPVTEKSDGTDQKTLSAGFLGALFALAPRSIRRRRNEE